MPATKGLVVAHVRAFVAQQIDHVQRRRIHFALSHLAQQLEILLTRHTDRTHIILDDVRINFGVLGYHHGATGFWTHQDMM
jgi:hypothetical protein